MEAKQLFEHALDLVLANDMDGFTDLFAPDCTVDFPFAAGTPEHLNGREALREYLADFPQRVEVKHFPSMTVHQTTDPDTVIAELTARGRTVSTGADYEMRYIWVVTVHDGAITTFRDYWSPVMAARQLGQLAEFAAALESEVRA